MTLIFIVSTIVFAIWYSMQDGEIFGAAQKINLGKVADPLRDCPVCMAPWYGSAVYWIFWHHDATQWILTIIPAMGVNVILIKLFPDKETPGLHQELGELRDSIVSLNMLLQDAYDDLKKSDDILSD